MSVRKKYITRSIVDRRVSLDRRITNWGPKDPDNEQRTEKNRRQKWEKRDGWKSINQWSSSPIQFNLSDVSNPPW